MQKKEWKYPSYQGTEFGETDNSNLSDLGRKIITTFIKENTVKIKIYYCRLEKNKESNRMMNLKE